MKSNFFLQTFTIAAVIALPMLTLFTACEGFLGPVGPPIGYHFNPDITYGSLTDSRDGKKYRTVQIGTQTWMAENLNYNAGGGSVCFNDKSSNCDRYGRLYNWATAMGLPSSCNSTSCANQVQANHRGICPAGWHVPSDAEWTTLTNFVGSNAGTKLKARGGWYYESNGTDDFGFSALPGGYRYSDGDFDSAGNVGHWWSATENDATDARGRYMNNYGSYANEIWDYKAIQLSLRCLQD